MPLAQENKNMWATSTEGFGPSFHGTDAEDTGNDKSIWDNDGETRHSNIKADNDENHQFIDVSAGARELQEGEEVTHAVVDGVGNSEGQPQHASSVGPGRNKGPQV